MKQLISATEAAAELGISPSTLKRFCDAKGIELIRTPGGHRRLEIAQLRIISTMMLAGERTSNTLQPAEVIKSLQAGLHQQLVHTIQNQVRSGIPLMLALEDYFISALWRLDSCSLIDAESTAHRSVRVCAATASLVLDSIAASQSIMEPTRTFVGATLPPSQDTLGSKLVAIGLRAENIRAIDLGPSVPADEIAEVANAENAEGVWISHTHMGDVELIAAEHRKLRRLLHPECRVFIGGGGISPAVRRTLSDCYYFETVNAMMESIAVRTPSESLN